MFAVAIPFFQRQPGILRRALASVCAQRDVAWPVQVLVVDDGSPVSAHTEIQDLALPPWVSVQIIEQANGGPGSARNAALDALGPDIRYVAFLDSDDEWSADHLSRAWLALEQGFDFYFADFFQIGQSIGAFERGGRIDIGRHPVLDVAAPGLHAYAGDMREQIMFGNVVGTPTVVYRRARFAQARFRADFRSAGEDYLFWMELAGKDTRIAFSSRIETTCGRGINVYAGAGWGTAQHLARVYDEMRYRRHLLQAYATTDAQRRRIRLMISRLRDDFADSLLSMLLHRKAIPWRLLRRHFRQDRSVVWRLPRTALKKAVHRH